MSVRSDLQKKRYRMLLYHTWYPATVYVDMLSIKWQQRLTLGNLFITVRVFVPSGNVPN